MAKIDIELKNRFFNNQDRKNAEVYDKEIKSEKRNASDNINLFNKPLARCNGFYKNNGVSHILLPLSSANLEQFYDESILLCEHFSGNSPFDLTIIDGQHKKNFLSMLGSNKFGFYHVCEIARLDPDLSKYVQSINIQAFSISFDSFCVDFELKYTKDFLLEFNNCLIEPFEVDKEYKKVFNNGQYSTAVTNPIPEFSRAEYVDDVLFEIKIRVVKFLSNHYSVFDDIDNTPPLSVDEYRTDLDFQDRFLTLYGYLTFYESELIKMPQERGDKTNKKLLISHFDPVKHSFYDLNRYRILYFTEKDEHTFVMDNLDFILLFFVQKSAIEKVQKILDDKYFLFERIGGAHCLSPIFKKYAELCFQINRQFSLLNIAKINFFENLFFGQQLKSCFIHLKQQVVELKKRDEELNNKINNVLSSKNNSVSIKIAVFALATAIISAIVSIILLFINLFK